MWGRFAGPNLSSHAAVPRRVPLECFFVNQVEAGSTHYGVLVDEELTETISFLSKYAFSSVKIQGITWRK